MAAELADLYSKNFRLQKKAIFHLQSAKTNGNASPLQKTRSQWSPDLPKIFRSKSISVRPVCEDELITEIDRNSCSSMELSSEKQSILKSLFPHIYDTAPCILTDESSGPIDCPINIGVVLSGGQAAGGHNVISGIFDFIKSRNKHSKLYGFLCGPHGVYSHKYVEIDEHKMSQYRNMGGFDIIRSGRHKIETEEQKQKSLEICKKLNLSGLVVIGGDDSNTNAAILAEYFKSKGSDISVIGCPKTIDGDLKNFFVEISFGFDTAVKTYSESIGNLMMDAASCGGIYHFVRLMGRSASIITLECALQTKPNLAFIGEEVQARNMSLNDLVDEIVNLIIRRSELKKDYGVILLPEGLIEFIPEVGILINEINSIVARGCFNEGALSPKSLLVFKSLPKTTQEQLLLDRDPHGNVQVAMIATERLLIQMVKKQLKDKKFSGRFDSQAHYFGYEGRSGFPSNFDSTYCYALGNGAAVLVKQRVTACMCVIKNMSSTWDAADWTVAGVPLTKMMTLETRKGKHNVPVIKKFLVDTGKPLFRAFEKVRDSWKLNDFYCSPGSPQLSGNLSHSRPFTLTGPPPDSTLMPMTDGKPAVGRSFRLSVSQMSDLQKSRMDSEILLNPILREKGCLLKGYITDEFPNAKEIFPYLTQNENGETLMNVFLTNRTYTPKLKASRVGVVLLGQLVPGVSNILLGLEERVSLNGGTTIGFFGADGLMNEKFIEVDKYEALVGKNQGGFTLLGRTAAFEAALGTEEGMKDASSSCLKLKLDALVIIGWTYLHITSMQEYFLRNNCETKIFGISPTADFFQFPVEPVLEYLKSKNGIDIYFENTYNKPNLDYAVTDSVGCNALGFDTMCRCESQLVGNLLTDSASAAKYFYFCLVGGGSGVEYEVILQTHCNICLFTDRWMDNDFDEIISYVVDEVILRCQMEKNYGCLVMNEDLLVKNTQFNSLCREIDDIFEEKQLDDQDIAEDENFEKFKSFLSKEMLRLFESLPYQFQQQLISLKHPGKSINMYNFASHELIAALVANEMKKEIARGFEGSFSPVCFSLISQVRCAIPSTLDCSFGLTLGFLAGVCACTGVPSSFIFIKDASYPPNEWEPYLVPLSRGGVVAHGLSISRPEKVMDRGREFLGGECGNYYFFLYLKISYIDCGSWFQDDTYCNPGPIQFEGEYSSFFNRSLYERSKLMK